MNWSLLASSYGAVFGNVQVLLMTFLGALGGVLLGAIPGMTATMGVALLIPFSFGMDLIPSIGLLLGIYCGGMYGGSISAILIHAPGTPSAAATLLDGYPMCEQNFVRFMDLENGNFGAILGHPIAIGFFVVAVAVVIFSVYNQSKINKREAANKAAMKAE